MDVIFDLNRLSHSLGDIDDCTIAMVEAPTTDRPLEPASSKLDAEVAETDHMADADGAEENGGAGAADPAAAQKTPATAKKAKAKVSGP